MRLTETVLRSLAAPAQDSIVGDDATTGLYFRHSAATGKITWVYRTRKGGAWRVEKIGQWPGVSLAAARARATALHDSVIPEAMTFGALLSEWFERRIEPRYRQTRNVGIYVAKGKAVLGSTKLTSLTTAGLVASSRTTPRSHLFRQTAAYRTGNSPSPMPWNAAICKPIRLTAPPRASLAARKIPCSHTD
jgi:hypothetical protein